MKDDHIISLKSAPQPPQAPLEERPEPAYPKKRRKNKYTAVVLTIAAALVVVAGIFFGVSAFSHRAPADSQDVINKVARLMLLPDETPTIAVVSNLGKLQGQAFFARAHQGDVVLMYPKAQKAVLYSPALDKIIEVAPITNDTQQ